MEEVGLQDQPDRQGPAQHKGSGLGTCTSMVRDSNIMGVGIHPTQTLFIPNTPRPTVGSIEGLAAPVGKNMVAVGLLPSLLASPLESEIVA